MGFVLMLHSLLRWLIVLVAIIAAVRFAIGFIRQQSYDKMANGLLMGFSGLMDLQGLLGLIVLIGDGIISGLWLPNRFVHLAIMLLAMVAAHMPARFKNAADNLRYRNGLIAVISAMVIVVIGVNVVGGSWTFSR